MALAAGIADDVAVGERAREGVEAGTVAEVNVANQADRLQSLQIAIDGSRVGRRSASRGRGELFSSPRAIGGKESFEQEAPGRRDSEAALANRRDGFVHVAGDD